MIGLSLFSYSYNAWKLKNLYIEKLFSNDLKNNNNNITTLSIMIYHLIYNTSLQ